MTRGRQAPRIDRRRLVQTTGAGLAGAALLGMRGSPGSAAQTPATETRTFDGAYGPVEVSANPQRVVVTAHFWLEPLLELGVAVVGAVTDQSTEIGPATSFTLSEGHDYPVDDIMLLGVGNELDLEATLVLDPDLIVQPVFGEDNREQYERLVRIAPVAAVDWAAINEAGEFIPAIVEAAAEAVGATDRLGDVRVPYEQALDEVRAVADEYGDDLTISVLQKFQPGEFTVRPFGLHVLTVMEDAGLSQLERQAQQERQSLSLEFLIEHDADVVLVDCAAPTEEACRDFVNDPIFQTLSAARNGQVEIFASGRYGGAAYRGLTMAARELTAFLDRDLDVSADFP